MTPRPTLYLRFVERQERVPVRVAGEVLIGGVSMTKTTRVLQQFWEHDGGDDAAGDMFNTVVGSWRDVEVVGA